MFYLMLIGGLVVGVWSWAKFRSLAKTPDPDGPTKIMQAVWLYLSVIGGMIAVIALYQLTGFPGLSAWLGS